MSEMQNMLDGINNKLIITEEKIHLLKKNSNETQKQQASSQNSEFGAFSVRRRLVLVLHIPGVFLSFTCWTDFLGGFDNGSSFHTGQKILPLESSSRARDACQ